MKRIFLYISVICGLGMVASCSDFFDEDSSYIIDADKNHFGTAADTLYSVIGILNKMQAIADRTILLGEARGDLVDVTATTSKDLRQLATFTVDDDNIYNSPEDYYAIINNCNYFIANVDPNMKNNRNEYVFRSEYAAVKAIRAWTYLQLVTTYGKVPFVTEPVMTASQAEQDYPMYGIQEVCDYFINEDGLQELTYPAVDYPHYGPIKLNVPSRLLYVPMDLVLGDLNLWAGHYLKAAEHYYSYITNRNIGGYYALGNDMIYWDSNKWQSASGLTFGYNSISTTTVSRNAEVITVIPSDSIPSEGYYLSLQDVFNTNTTTDDHDVELMPSQQLVSLSAAQDYYYYDKETQKAEVAPKKFNTDEYLNGDLRLQSCFRVYRNFATSNGQSYDDILNNKYATNHARIYRRALVYLRLAEALNRAGFPHYAYMMLATGVNSQMLTGGNVDPFNANVLSSSVTDIMTNGILSYYSPADQEKLKQFSFPGNNTTASGYCLDDFAGGSNSGQKLIGFHSRGSGCTPYNPNYLMPTGTLEEQILAVEDLIVNEEALEFAFEGYRYYDLMRVALRRTDDPNYLANKINARRGAGQDAGIIGQIGDLNSKTNWFLTWGNRVGY